MATPPTNHECVGTLLIPSQDVQELTVEASSPPGLHDEVTLQRRGTTGTLLLNPQDLQTHAHDKDVTLQRRITTTLQEMPVPDDEDAGNWPD
mmetsp:Transcript_3825/g.4574  ORF Transcript_3825/g.4574 Transcript_3825/m.4574 type:complete len:92 (+) Transcript_3825:160-435(+)|eukprot:CAMPEP_0195245902 /NCGR_PEP_ID=MMETSP0706-20130129/103_1 /TAXON_ID=33640 /ORGANISM="Asterionellopsis glacialis, Strain CCMP134" /LENGTH=91 /DNA_ID=CAMNT_0040297215 /DNA_START=144 /DNA_END=419 /DNA_ORIENTATION=+